MLKPYTTLVLWLLLSQNSDQPVGQESPDLVSRENSPRPTEKDISSGNSNLKTS